MKECTTDSNFNTFLLSNFERNFKNIYLSFIICMHVCMHAQLLSSIQFFVMPWTVARQAPLSMQFPNKNTGVGCHFLLQGIFLIQGSNLPLLHLQHWQADSLPLSHWEAPIICMCNIYIYITCIHNLFIQYF